MSSPASRFLAPFCVAVGVAATLAACGGGDEGAATQATATDTATSTTATAPNLQPGTCARVSQPAPKRGVRLSRPALELEQGRTYRAEVQTSCGNFTITLDSENSPKTAASFVYLARRGFYDNLTFHRIVPGFVIQGGDPAGNGSGDPGYSVVEAPPPGAQYTRGVVAMAKTEIEAPGTSGSQFYVVTGEDAQLPPDYAVLGRVTAGQTTVDAIGTAPIAPPTGDPNQADRPAAPIVIRRITIR